MIEYGNYFHKEDINFFPLDEENYLAFAVQRARNIKDSKERVFCVRSAVQTLFQEALCLGEAKFGIEQIGEYIIIYAMFDYNGVVYYWWEKYINASESQNGFDQDVLNYDLKYGIDNAYADAWHASEKIIDTCVYTLEYQFRKDPIVTYVVFSSNLIQSPLICVSEYLKKLKLR